MIISTKTLKKIIAIIVLLIIGYIQYSSTNTQENNVSENASQLYAVIDIVDGDTIKVADIGTIRLIGLDTPETVDPRKEVQCFGVEASNKMKELLSNQQVKLEYDLTQGMTDKYGRTLAYVFRNDGLFINLEMIREGYGYEYTYATPYKYQLEFKNAQTEARTEKLGLWGMCQ